MKDTLRNTANGTHLYYYRKIFTVSELSIFLLGWCFRDRLGSRIRSTCGTKIPHSKFENNIITSLNTDCTTMDGFDFLPGIVVVVFL